MDEEKTESGQVLETRHHYHNPYPYRHRHRYHHRHQGHLPGRYVYRHYRSRSTRKRLLCWLVGCGLVTLIFILVLILPLRYSTGPHDNEDNNELFAPVDTAVISYSHPLCNSLLLESPPGTEFYIETTLYLLEELPPLERKEIGSFYRESSLFETYEFWKVFFYAGSTANYSACHLDLSTDDVVTFYLVKGHANYKRWQQDYTNYLHKERVNVTCQANNNATFTFNIEAEDNYYFIFYSEISSALVGVTFDYERLLYDASNSSIIDECSIFLNSSKSCYVDVPLSPKPTALLELDSFEDDSLPWDTDVRVHVSCSARSWLYAVIAISAFAFVGVLIAAAIIVFLCFCKESNKDSESSGTSPNEESNLITKHQEKVADAPPPYQ